MDGLAQAMLRIAAGGAALLTVVESTVLSAALHADPVTLGLALASFNLPLAFLVGHLALSHGIGRRAGVIPVPIPEIPGDGLTPQAARQIAEVLAGLEGVKGVLIADRERVLASSGPAFAESAAVERAWRVARTSLRRARARITRLGPLPAVACPLAYRSNPRGALVIAGEGAAGDLARAAEVLARVLAMQVELAERDREARLAAEAELRALRAQIHPHFLFNALNTVVHYVREDPEMARRLLVRLADLLRGSIHLDGHLIPFAEEYQHIRNYLFIEQARFRDRLRVVYDIDPQVLKVGVPALSVQPLVENAVRHGIAPKTGPGTVLLRARLDLLTLRVHITVRDDGVGMPAEQVAALLRPGSGILEGRGRRGVGLRNVSERLRRLYGNAYVLRIDSAPGRGTTVHLQLPMR